MSVLLVSAFAGVLIGIGLTAAVVVGSGLADQTVTEQAIRTAQPTLDMEYISKKVTEMYPSKFLLDTITRQIRDEEKLDSQIKRFYSVSSKDLVDTLSSAASGNGSASSAPCKEFTANGTAQTVWILPANRNIWAKSDTLLMRGLTLPAGGIYGAGGDTITVNVMFIVNDTTSTCIEIRPVGVLTSSKVVGLLNAGSTAYIVPTFTSSQTLIRMSKAMEETAMMATSWQQIPEPDTQYCQLNMATFKESTFQKNTKQEVIWGMPQYEKQNLYDFRATSELTKIWGVIGNPIGDAGTLKRYTSNGITRYIDNTLEWGTGAGGTITESELVGWAKSLFVGNSGSTEKFLFLGSDIVEQLAILLLSKTNKQIGAEQTMERWGIKFKRLETQFGDFNIIHHPLITAVDPTFGMALDMENINKSTFKSMNVYNLDLKTSGISNAEARTLAESDCLTLMYPDCHALFAKVGSGQV
jgi:hypothetical protein